MGWTTRVTDNTKSKARKTAERSFGNRLVRSSMGLDGNLYVCSYSHGSDQKKLSVVLLEKFQESWGYKVIDEDMGPYYDQCPQRVMDAADEPVGEPAAKFRERCQEALKRAERIRKDSREV